MYSIHSNTPFLQFRFPDEFRERAGKAHCSHVRFCAIPCAQSKSRALRRQRIAPSPGGVPGDGKGRSMTIIDTHSDSDVRVWLLRGVRTGDNNQLDALAEALPWSFEAIDIEYNPLFCCPNWMTGASRASARRVSKPLAPPWPDLVIGIGQRSVPLARWIKRQNGGRTKLVQLGRPRAPLDWFDLIVTTPQYGLPERPNVLRNALPPHRLSLPALAEARANWAPRFGHLPHPRIALMVGGPTWAYRLDAATGRDIARRADAAARAAGGSLLVSTCPRTPREVADAVTAEISVPSHVYRWDRESRRDSNPFTGYLALADRFFVTEESVSLLADTCATGKPVTVVPLRKYPGAGLLEALAMPSCQARYANLIERGIFTPPRRIRTAHEHLVQLGLARWHEGLLEVYMPAESPHEPIERTVSRIVQVVGADTAFPKFAAE
jgi:mitochondrial fission protein ELM1